MASASAALEYEKLSEYLKALSNPNRLELLYQLRFPHTASEISLTPKRNEADGNPDRLISRQAVERHLGVLEAIGVVVTQRNQRDGRPVDEYVVNHASLFAVVEELKKLATIKAVAEVDPLATQGAAGTPPMPPGKPSSLAKGPRLLLVAGVYEGRAYPLEKDGEGKTQWLIGRKEGSTVRLDYDPFVSGENTRIVLDGGRYFVEDIATSRNGTLLNYEQMPRGGRVPLEQGDLVGVGRSLLLFRAQ